MSNEQQNRMVVISSSRKGRNQEDGVRNKPHATLHDLTG